MSKTRLDVDFGLLLPLLTDEASFLGIKRGELVREFVREGMLKRSMEAEHVRLAVRAVIAALRASEPARDVNADQLDQAQSTLAAVLGSVAAAQGIADALTTHDQERRSPSRDRDTSVTDSKPFRLDVDFGDMLALLAAEALAHGVTRTEIIRNDVRHGLLARKRMEQPVRDAVGALLAAREPDERYDPVDDPRAAEAWSVLATLLGSAAAANGIAEALVEQPVEMMTVPPGVVLDEHTLAQVDDLCAQLPGLHDRASLLAALVAQAHQNTCK